MGRRMIQRRSGRFLVLLLALALLPSPIFLTWFLSQPRPAQAAETTTRAAGGAPVTDVAPRQPLLPPDPNGPRQRLASLGLLPTRNSVSPVALSGPLPDEVRSELLAELTLTVGQTRALEALDRIESPPPPPTPVLAAPEPAPAVPDPFVRPPLKVDYRRPR
jgi:hypothetical protein